MLCLGRGELGEGPSKAKTSVACWLVLLDQVMPHSTNVRYGHLVR